MRPSSQKGWYSLSAKQSTGQVEHLLMRPCTQPENQGKFECGIQQDDRSIKADEEKISLAEIIARQNPQNSIPKPITPGFQRSTIPQAMLLFTNKLKNSKNEGLTDRESTEEYLRKKEIGEWVVRPSSQFKNGGWYSLSLKIANNEFEHTLVRPNPKNKKFFDKGGIQDEQGNIVPLDKPRSLVEIIAIAKAPKPGLG